MRHSLRTYLAAVLRQWWTYAGIAAGIIGYGLDVFTDLKLPVTVWIALFAGCLVIAQYLAYHDVHTKLAAVNAKPLPQWAMWAHNANSDGAWLTFMVVGRPRAEEIQTAILDEIITATAESVGLARHELRIETFAGFLRIKSPDADGTPEFLLQLGLGDYCIVILQWRTQANPVSLGWVLGHLESGIEFTQLEIIEGVFRKRGVRRYSVSLGNWPDAGVTPEPLSNLRRLSANWMKGGRVYREFRVSGKQKSLWPILLSFARAVLGDAGYVNFEPSLAMLTRQSLAAANTRDFPAAGPIVR
jgi:hypothetical protein